MYLVCASSLKGAVLTRLNDKDPERARRAPSQKVSRSGKTPWDGETRCTGMFEADLCTIRQLRRKLRSRDAG